MQETKPRAKRKKKMKIERTQKTLFVSFNDCYQSKDLQTEILKVYELTTLQVRPKYFESTKVRMATSY